MHDDAGYSLELVRARAQELQKVSPTFCLAKWTQSTVLLQNGLTHSCHHPARHRISQADLVNNPQGLHNTPVKLRARSELLRGKQTPECSYCWNIENLNRGHISDRIYKSTYSWSFPRLEEILSSGLGQEIAPSYLEVSFDSTCNAKCLYCNPESSSSWEAEIRRFGPMSQVEKPLYDLGDMHKRGALPIPPEEPNPYTEAFWKWWPEIYQKLMVLRITGGEPLLSNHTWRLIEEVLASPRRELRFAVNSNLCIPRSLVTRLVDQINALAGKIHSFEVYTSLESVGTQAEYVRYGMRFDDFLENCHYVLDHTPPSSRLHFMTTINLLSAPSFLGYLELLRNLRRKYKVSKNDFRVRTFLNYLRWPQFLSLSLLPQHLKDVYADEWVEFVKKHLVTASSGDAVFYEEELDQVERLVAYMQTCVPEKRDFENFRLFITEIDRRRGLDFVATFPELRILLERGYFGELRRK